MTLDKKIWPPLNEFKLEKMVGGSGLTNGEEEEKKKLKNG